MAKDKGKAPEAEAEDRDEDEREDERADAADDGDDADEKAAASGDDADGTDDDESDDDGEPEERDASTKGVAEALGVDQAEGEGAEAKGDEAAVPNRAARRRDEVMKKRRARTEQKRGADKSEKADDDEAEGDDEAVAAREPLPKDKNLRAKELLKRRQEAASKKGSTAVGLSAGEMVQDSLARAGSGASKWFRQNFKAVAATIVIGVVGTAGVLYYLEHREEKAGKTTDSLAKAVLTEQAPVIADDKRPDEQKALDPMPVFSSEPAKADAVLAAYTKVVEEHPGTGPGILGKLGQAGAYLDKNLPDQAFSAYEDVLRTDLAKADVDVRARAIEGKGFALEAKKDYDGAMNVFKELEGVEKSYVDLAKYHQARMHLVKGEKDKGKEILVALYKALEVPTLEGPQTPHLRALVEETLRGIDPTLVRPKRNLGGPKGTPSPEELEKIKQQILEMQKKQGEEGHGH